jgi:hypothetical protein
MQRSSVDLPDPEGPIRIDGFQDIKRAVTFYDLSEFYDAHVI